MTALVNPETGEVIDSMSAAEAEVVTDSIKWRLDQLATAHEEVMPMIRDALVRRAWEALGYRSPGEYAADRFGGALTRLSTPVRQAVVQELAEAGMSSRAIAPVVGVTDRQARRDATAGGTYVPPAEGEGNSASGADDPAQTEATSGDNRPEDYPAAPAPAPRPPVVGVDGKTYTRPTPVDPATALKAAVAEFPDLAYYVAVGRQRDAINMADDLRRFRDRGELDVRLDNLRRSIALDRAKRDGSYRPGTTAALGDDGEYRMVPLAPVAAATTRTCPTCSGRGVIEE